MAIGKTRGCCCSRTLLIMGGEAPETCWATYKRQVINSQNCRVLLVDLFESYDDARSCERQSWLTIFKTIHISQLHHKDSVGTVLRVVHKT